MKHLLMVDDNRGDALLLEEALETTGWGGRLERIADGSAALARLQTGPRPDLLVLDLNLPGWGGRELLARLQGRPDLAGIPAVVFSGSPWEEAALVAEGFPAGRYLVKPDSFDGFVGIANILMNIMGKA
ncbi:response regulator [Mesoterricola sediminis]|uniref:Response regulator n=1 Tax=Mesoterricola sediminis TaxID=2927980 RepID=A0AA48GWH7_9BACT|nr:response regulator [Mesoterricola sediminis]BDU76945.1 response regulator [Mesoterricola sediminis]